MKQYRYYINRLLNSRVDNFIDAKHNAFQRFMEKEKLTQMSGVFDRL